MTDFQRTSSPENGFHQRQATSLAPNCFFVLLSKSLSEVFLVLFKISWRIKIHKWNASRRWQMWEFYQLFICTLLTRTILGWLAMIMLWEGIEHKGNPHRDTVWVYCGKRGCDETNCYKRIAHFCNKIIKYTPPLKSLHRSSSAQSFLATEQQRNPPPPLLLFEPSSSFSF